MLRKFIFFKKPKPKVRKRKALKVKDVSWKKHKTQAQNKVTKIISELHLPKGFEYNKITIKNQKTIWGSCSSKKNLNFNYRIIYLPDDLAKYLVVHEFCHLKHMNHSKNFWEQVEMFLPDYKILRRKLREFTRTSSVMRVR